MGYAAAAQVVDHFRSFLAGSTHYLEAASVDAAQSRLARSYNLSQATSALVAQHLFDAYKHGWPLEWLDQYPDDLASVSQEFVVEAAAACRRHALILVTYNINPH